MHALVGLLSLLVATSAPAPAAGGTVHGAFLLRVGADTIAVERFERSASRLRGELLFRAADQRWTYDLELDPGSGYAERMHTEFRRASSGVRSPALQSGEFVFAGDSVFVTVGARAPERHGSRAGVTPYINPSFALQEHIARLAQARAADASVPAFAVSGGSTFDVRVSRVAADSLQIEVGGVVMLMQVDAAGDFVRGGVPSQGLTLTRVAQVDDALFTVAPPDYSAPAGAPYTALEVKVPTRSGFTLAGTLTLPTAAKRPVPCVVTITGSGPEDRDERIAGVKGYRIFAQVADALGRHGIAVLRLDDRGTGESGGKFAGSTSNDFAADIEDAIAWLRRDPRIDGSRLGLVGHSEGGIIAPMIAERDPRLRAIVLMAAPAWTGRRILEYQNGFALDRGRPASAAVRDSLLRAAMSEVDSLAARNPWLGFFVAHDPLSVARRVRTPVLLLHGENDRQVTVAQMDELAEAFRAGGNHVVEAHRFAGLDHLFLTDASGDPVGYARLADTSVPESVLQALAGFLNRQLR